MNSMMDMVTIILLFLLKTYSTEGQLKANVDDLTMPESYRLVKPTRTTTVSVSKSVIMVGDRVVMRRDQIQPDQNLLAPLSTELRQIAEKGKEIESYGGEWKGDVMLIIDKTVPYEVLTKVIYTCGKSEHDQIKMMVQSTTGVEMF